MMSQKQQQQQIPFPYGVGGDGFPAAQFPNLPLPPNMSLLPQVPQMPTVPTLPLSAAPDPLGSLLLINNLSANLNANLNALMSASSMNRANPIPPPAPVNPVQFPPFIPPAQLLNLNSTLLPVQPLGIPRLPLTSPAAPLQTPVPAPLPLEPKGKSPAFRLTPVDSAPKRIKRSTGSSPSPQLSASVSESERAKQPILSKNAAPVSDLPNSTADPLPSNSHRRKQSDRQDSRVPQIPSPRSDRSSDPDEQDFPENNSPDGSRTSNEGADGNSDKSNSVSDLGRSSSEKSQSNSHSSLMYNDSVNNPSISSSNLSVSDVFVNHNYSSSSSSSSSLTHNKSQKPLGSVSSSSSGLGAKRKRCRIADMNEEQKKVAREANRLSAQRHRDRASSQWKTIQEQFKQLTYTNVELKLQLSLFLNQKADLIKTIQTMESDPLGLNEVEESSQKH